MLKMVLIGTGNIAKFFFDVLSGQPEIQITQVLGRNEKALAYFRNTVPVSSDFDELKQADVYILALSDEAIGTVAKRLDIREGLLVHTAGSIAMEVLPENMRRGVLYPLQTLSGVLPEKMSDIPMCIEASREDDYALLEKIARCISRRVDRIDSSQRRQLHLAAVFANNFSNHMFFLSSRICEEQGVSFDLMRPLIRESCVKVMEQKPYDAQTGPARRGDQKTLEAHLNMLASSDLRSIYSTLSESIQKTYEREL